MACAAIPSFRWWRSAATPAFCTCGALESLGPRVDGMSSKQASERYKDAGRSPKIGGLILLEAEQDMTSSDLVRPSSHFIHPRLNFHL